MKKRILLAIARTPLYFLMHLARLTLRLCDLLWRLLDRYDSLEGLSVRQIAEKRGLKHYEAYELWKELNPDKVKPKTDVEIHDYRSSSPSSTFAIRSI